MDTNSVKQSVVESYSKLAKSRKNGLFSNLFACCAPQSNSKNIAEHIGYSKEELEQVPTDSNLGVGCGNPSALTKISNGEVVVDLGSGAGFDAFIVSKSVGKNGKVIGVDLSEDMLDLARSNAKQGSYKNVEFFKGDIEALPLNNNLADHVISNCVINLSLNKAKVFKEAYRVLKKGGKLSVSDIVLEKELPDFIKDSLVGHIACVSGAEHLDDYVKYIREAGFIDVEVQSKTEFPLELMLSDPQVMKIAQEMNFSLDSKEARDLASRVISISLTARK